MSGTSYYNDTIVKELDNITSSVANSSTTTAKLINSEVNRLKERQSEIIDAKFGQNRIIDLNRDQMKRNMAYMKVGILTIVCLGIVLLFRLFGSFIPEAILGLIYVILVSVCVFYGLLVYTDVNGRESTNFDRYNIPPPVIDMSDDAKSKQLAAAAKAGNLLAANDTKLCSGQTCCDYGTAYDSEKNKCLRCANINEFYIGANKKCGVCETGQFYMRETQSCSACPGGKTYNPIDMKCD
jgi:hypothetical protein